MCLRCSQKGKVAKVLASELRDPGPVTNQRAVRRLHKRWIEEVIGELAAVTECSAQRQAWVGRGKAGDSDQYGFE